MKKSAIFKSILISTMLIALVVAIIPAVNAIVTLSDTETATGLHGEGVGVGVQGSKINTPYYQDCYWHAGAWMGEGVMFMGLYWDFYANGVLTQSGFTYDTSHDLHQEGLYRIISGSATGLFRYNDGSTYALSTAQAQLPYVPI